MITHLDPYFTSAPREMVEADPRYTDGMWCVDSTTISTKDKKTVWIARGCTPMEPTDDVIREMRNENCKALKKGVV